VHAQNKCETSIVLRDDMDSTGKAYGMVAYLGYCQPVSRDQYDYYKIADCCKGV